MLDLDKLHELASLTTERVMRDKTEPDKVHIHISGMITEFVKQHRKEIDRLQAERDAAVRDLDSIDHCDCCLNFIKSEELYYDSDNQEHYPRKYKCDSCYLGSGGSNNFEWRGLESKK